MAISKKAPRLCRNRTREPLVGPNEDVRVTAVVGGSQTIRFEQFTFQASSSAGGMIRNMGTAS